jgi:hypothetical protein
MWKYAPAALILLLVLAACQLTTPTPVDGSETPELTSEADTEITFGPGPFNLGDPSAGLAALPAYTATLTVTFDGTRDGQAEQWSRTHILTVSGDPPGRMLSIAASGSPEDAELDGTTMIEMNGAFYERAAAGPCTANAALEGGDPTLADLAPALPSVIGADEAGTETVNGVEANHYTFDQRALGMEGLAEASGDVWVAADGGYILRYALTEQGDANYFGEGTEGTVTWDYTLDPSAPAAIAIPDDCPAGLIDAPVMDDAQNTQQLPSVTMFETPSDAAAVLAFYSEQLVALGWTLQGEPVVTEVMTLATFLQGDQQLSLIITPTDAGSKVRLLLGDVVPAAQMPGMPGITPTP